MSYNSKDMVHMVKNLDDGFTTFYADMFVGGCFPKGTTPESLVGRKFEVIGFVHQILATEVFEIK